jgi:hypothetical protein
MSKKRALQLKLSLLVLRTKAKAIYDQVTKAAAQQKLHAGQVPGEFYKPEPVYWEPPSGVSDDVRRAFPGRSQEASYLGRSAAYQRMTGRY